LFLAFLALVPLFLGGLAGWYATHRYRCERARLDQVTSGLKQAEHLLSAAQFDEAERCLTQTEAELAQVAGWLYWTPLGERAVKLRQQARQRWEQLGVACRQEEVLGEWSERLRVTGTLWEKGDLKEADRALRGAEADLVRDAGWRPLPPFASRWAQIQRQASDQRQRVDESFCHRQALFTWSALLAEARRSLELGSVREADRVLRQAEADMKQAGNWRVAPCLRGKLAQMQKQLRAQRKLVAEWRSTAELAKKTARP
jgi:hypothetical protein